MTLPGITAKELAQGLSMLSVGVSLFHKGDQATLLDPPGPFPPPEARKPAVVPPTTRKRGPFRWRGPRFRWYDLFWGCFWDRKARVLYFCPLPCIVLAFWFDGCECEEFRRSGIIHRWDCPALRRKDLTA